MKKKENTSVLQISLFFQAYFIPNKAEYWERWQTMCGQTFWQIITTLAIPRLKKIKCKWSRCYINTISLLTDNLPEFCVCKPCACLCFVNSVPAADVRRQGSRFILQLVSFFCVCVLNHCIYGFVWSLCQGTQPLYMAKWMEIFIFEELVLRLCI